MYGYDPPPPSGREVLRSCAVILVAFVLLAITLAGLGQFIVTYGRWQ